MRGLPAGAHLHLHCHGGQGRTSTFFALYDMLRNASHTSLDASLDRVRLLGRYCLCFARTDFREVYRYAKREGLGGSVSWTTWLAHEHAAAS